MCMATDPIVPQQQVLRHQIAVPLAGRTYDCEGAQDEIKHPRSIADLMASRHGQGIAVPHRFQDRDWGVGCAGCAERAGSHDAASLYLPGM